MKVLISGGAGFIGSHVTEELLNNNYDVVVIDNLATGVPENVPDNVRFYHSDLNDPELEYVFEIEKPDIVIHLAAQASVTMSMENPYDDFFTNTAGSLKILLLSEKYQVKKLLFASTAAVYGDPLYLPIDEKHEINPESYYAQSKYSAESYIKLYTKLSDLESSILRFSNVYGPRQNSNGEAGVISIFINQLLNEKKVSIFDGNQTRDFVYVKDVARACRLAIESKGGGVFNVSSSTETSINDLFRLISEIIGVNSLPTYKPLRLGEIERSFLDNRKAQQELKWNTQYSLLTGLKETITSYSGNPIYEYHMENEVRRQA